MGGGERTAEHREILAEDEDRSAIDGTVAGHHAVARRLLLGHAEISAVMLHEHVPLLEGAGIEQQFQPFTRRQLALGMLRLDTFGPAALAGLGALFFQLADNVLHETPRTISGTMAERNARPEHDTAMTIVPGSIAYRQARQNSRGCVSSPDIQAVTGRILKRQTRRSGDLLHYPAGEVRQPGVG